MVEKHPASLLLENPVHPAWRPLGLALPGMAHLTAADRGRTCRFYAFRDLLDTGTHHASNEDRSYPPAVPEAEEEVAAAADASLDCSNNETGQFLLHRVDRVLSSYHLRPPAHLALPLTILD